LERLARDALESDPVLVDGCLDMHDNLSYIYDHAS